MGDSTPVPVPGPSTSLPEVLEPLVVVPPVVVVVPPLVVVSPAVVVSPLVVVPPTRYRVQQRRVGDVSRAIDISATLLDFIGTAPIGSGRSLVPAMLHGTPLVDPEVLFGPADVMRGRDG